MKTKSTNQLSGDIAQQTKHNGALAKTKDPLLKKIIAYLCLHHNLDVAFLISKQIHGTEGQVYFPAKKPSVARHFTYTLCIITDKPPHNINAPNPAQLMDELYNHTQKQARVYLIPFTAAAVAEKINYGNNFLVSVLNTARCVYSAGDWWVRLKRFGVNHHPEITSGISKHWQARFQRANYLHNITGVVDTTENPVAHFGVLQNVLKQTCLGLIYVFWEYTPSCTSLSYLLHLCSHFAAFPAKLFHGNTYQNHLILHHLCQAEQYMQYKIQSPLSLKQTDKAWKKCDTFLREAQSLAEQQLDHLDQKSGEHISKLKHYKKNRMQARLK